MNGRTTEYVGNSGDQRNTCSDKLLMGVVLRDGYIDIKHCGRWTDT